MIECIHEQQTRAEGDVHDTSTTLYSFSFLRRPRCSRVMVTRVVHGSHFSVIFYLIFDISLPKTENDPKMKPKMSSKMATVNDPIVCGRIFFGKRKLS